MNFVFFTTVFLRKFTVIKGRNFETRVIKQLCKLLGIKKSSTTPYHPMGNGSAERFNQTLIKMLSTLSEEHKTAFLVGNFGFYECNTMCFGLTYAPTTFQRLVEKCMGELHFEECLILLDDISI